MISIPIVLNILILLFGIFFAASWLGIQILEMIFRSKMLKLVTFNPTDKIQSNILYYEKFLRNEVLPNLKENSSEELVVNFYLLTKKIKILSSIAVLISLTLSCFIYLLFLKT